MDLVANPTHLDVYMRDNCSVYWTMVSTNVCVEPISTGMIYQKHANNVSFISIDA